MPARAAKAAPLGNYLTTSHDVRTLYVHASVPAWSAVGSIVTGASLDQVAAPAPGDFVISRVRR
jgi:hypothetical protein